MQRLKLLFFCVLIMFMASCKRHKLKKNEIEITLPKEVIQSVDSVIVIPEKIEKVKYTFNTEQTGFDKIKIKTKISFKSEKMNQNFPANIHMAKDSTIWISITLGLEAARASINPDSIFFMDRLNRNYYKLSFDEINKQFNFNLTFAMLQSLLIGNLAIPIDTSDIFNSEINYKSILQKRNDIEILNKFDLILNKLFSIKAKDEKSNTNLTIDYKNFTTADEKVVPRIITVIISSLNPLKPKDISIEIEHLKFDFLDRNIRFPYNVPKGYTLEKIPNF